MTREEIAERLRANATGDLHRALADAVRALPVIATCGECRRATMLGQQRDAQGMPGYACTHDLLLGTPVEGRMVTASALNSAIAPPSWCPLRGKR